MSINVLNNDTDIDSNDRLTLSHISTSNSAKVAIKENKIRYTPNKDYTGEETLTYTIKDKQGATAQASIEITVRELTDEEKYAQLENSGVIPKLDRSDSLGGTDSDNNGIRDDVDAHINNTYTEPKEKAAAQQMARAYQMKLLVDLNNEKSINDTALSSKRAIYCARDVTSDKNIMYDIRAVTYNTKKRVKKYFAFDNLRDGSVTSMPEGDTCEK